jgi:hypothetical protein
MPPAFARFESRRIVYPQLALWATGMTSAAPTEAFPYGRATALLAKHTKAATGRRTPKSARARRHLHCRHTAKDNSLAAGDAFGIYLWIEDGARVGDHGGEECGFARV